MSGGVAGGFLKTLSRAPKMGGCRGASHQKKLDVSGSDSEKTSHIGSFLQLLGVHAGLNWEK